MADVQVTLSLPALRTGVEPETGLTVVTHLQLMLNERGGFLFWSRMGTSARQPRRQSSTISRTKTLWSMKSWGNRPGRPSCPSGSCNRNQANARKVPVLPDISSGRGKLGAPVILPSGQTAVTSTLIDKSVVDLNLCHLP